jgi:hypothetical protein
MSSTYSNLKFQLMATGDNSGTWGNVTNVNLGTAVEEAIVGSADVTFASANVTLTLTNTNATQTARNLRLNLTGTTGGARDLIVPAIEKVYIVNNGCADTITVKVTGQTGVAVPAGCSYLLYNNGTDVVNALNKISSFSGGTGLNTLTAESVIIGNGTNTIKLVAPGTAGNALVSDGSTWVSQAAGGFDSGTVTLFGQSTAPTGWTKNTSTGDEHTFRIVTGSVSTGGSVDFTTAFASQTPTGSVSITSISGSAGSTTLTTPQIPSHSHPSGNLTPSGPFAGNMRNPNGGPFVVGNMASSTGSTGGGGSHDHPFSFSSGSGTFTGNSINLAVKYVDVIRATKN